MADNDYRHTFTKAKEEHEKLARKRDAIDVRMTQLQQLMVSLAPLIGENPPEAQTGFTDAVRQILKASPEPLTPVDIHKNVKSLGIAMPENPQVSIHVALKRLAKAKEIIGVRDANGTKKYKWVGRYVTISIPVINMKTGTDPLRSFIADPPLPLVDEAAKQKSGKK